ncbi:MAG: hypothetical protein KA450_03865 [Bacteroidia bacterium]|nr:hypothetical protein [Bacteroidia bacterium]
MNRDSIENIFLSTDRHKIYVLPCKPNEIEDAISFVMLHKINLVNIGEELANYINTLEDLRYLTIDVYDYTRRLLEKNRTKIENSINEIVAIYNLGILLEPTLEMNVITLLKEFSKSSCLIIIWENQQENQHKLHWATQQQKYFLDFSEVQLKNLQYEI